jgi:hypothetical protein
MDEYINKDQLTPFTEEETVAFDERTVEPAAIESPLRSSWI